MYINLELGDFGIYCHDISQQKVSWYYYISQYIIFSQPETNYTIECIILVDLQGIYSYTLYEEYFQTFMTAAVIVILVNTVFDKHSLQTGLSILISFMP